MQEGGIEKGHRSIGVLFFLPFGGDTVEEAVEDGDLLGGAAGEERDQPPNGGAGEPGEDVRAEVRQLGLGIGEDIHLPFAGAEPFFPDVELPAYVRNGAVAGGGLAVGEHGYMRLGDAEPLGEGRFGKTAASDYSGDAGMHGASPPETKIHAFYKKVKKNINDL